MDERHVLSILEAFGGSNIAELEIAEGNFRMMLRKDVAVSRVVHVHSAQGAAPDRPALAAMGAAASHDVAGSVAQQKPAPAPAPVPAARPAPEAPSIPAAEPAASASVGETIDSPLVGTFYLAPTPDAPPFVKAGDRVKAGDKICILEAMKMMNSLEAEFDCEIVAVLASSGQLVEYGQALFEVRRD
ncbi:MAG: acetyl-CoA carboxylase biotin carboxyl carrier protein [Treponema sp.]|nr:acetyl-CoA carboxylase biotin carboxyl carrier protein [Treponema sp.]